LNRIEIHSLGRTELKKGKSESIQEIDRRPPSRKPRLGIHTRDDIEMLSSLKAALVLVQFVVALTIAAPFDTHEIHEKRDFVPAGWQQGQRLDEAFILPIQIGLKQSNIDKLHDMLMSVSLPDSPEYGQHWTPEKVRATFAPSKESRETVISWLIESGIDSYRLDHSKASGGWIKFNASVAEAEALFKTQYYGWSHPLGKRGSITPAVRSSYSLPAHVRSHVDFITPTLHFNVKLDLRRGLRQNEAISLKTKKKKKKKSRLNYLGSPGGPVSPVIRPIPAGTHISAVSLATCASLITPNCLRALYGIPTLATNTRTNPSNSLGIVEYTPQQYIPSDMLQFFSNFSTQQVQRTPTMVSIDGGSINYNTPSSSIFAYSGESNLDLQYAMALVNPLKVTLYQTGDQTEGASFGDFLDALDSSYCAGDDPMQDAVYRESFYLPFS
jgi:tripeptidyl-peptidase-1